MKIIQQNYNVKTLNLDIIYQIDNFILLNSENQNSLFISPVFAIDYSKRYKIEFEYIVFISNKKICALKLIFNEYKFYQRLVDKKIISFFIKPLLKIFFPKKWFILFYLVKRYQNLIKKKSISSIKNSLTIKIFTALQ